MATAVPENAGPRRRDARLRVTFVNPASGLGGSERSLLDLLAALGSAAEVDRALVLFSEGPLAARARELGVEVSILPLSPALARLGESSATERPAARTLALGRAGLGALPFVAALRRQLRRGRPHVVHTNGMKAHLLALAAVPELPRVVHLRDFASERPVTRHALPLLGFRSIVVTNSRAVASDALRVAPSLRTRVVYNGIDLAEFQPGPGDAGRLARLAGLGEPPEGAVNVGLVATYAWWKGHRRFLEAAAEVRAALPDVPVRFYVVGGPIYETRGSEVSAGELERIIFERGLAGHAGLVPFQTDAAAVYRALDVVVHASERPEPFGRTIVEAMATGRAVVAARAGGAAELFEHGETAFGYEPEVPGALGRALVEVVGNRALRERLGEAARPAAEARFDRQRLGPELMRVYRELCGRPRG